MDHKSINVVLQFIGVIILNHFLLIIGIDKLFNGKTKIDRWISVGSLFFKFFFLIAIFYYAMQTIPEKIAFLMGIFIFQLIILVLSIKRNIKLN